MEGKKGRRREEGVECGEKRTIHCGVMMKAHEDHFYHTQKPWRGLEVTKVCVYLGQSALVLSCCRLLW